MDGIKIIAVSIGYKYFIFNLEIIPIIIVNIKVKVMIKKTMPMGDKELVKIGII